MCPNRAALFEGESELPGDYCGCVPKGKQMKGLESNVSVRPVFRRSRASSSLVPRSEILAFESPAQYSMRALEGPEPGNE